MSETKILVHAFLNLTHEFNQNLPKFGQIFIIVNLQKYNLLKLIKTSWSWFHMALFFMNAYNLNIVILWAQGFRNRFTFRKLTAIYVFILYRTTTARKSWQVNGAHHVMTAIFLGCLTICLQGVTSFSFSDRMFIFHFYIIATAKTSATRQISDIATALDLWFKCDTIMANKDFGRIGTAGIYTEAKEAMCF